MSLPAPAYPFGAVPPPAGTLIDVAPGVAWWSQPVPGPLRQVNGYILDDPGPHGPGVTIVDTGFDSAALRAGWQALLDGPLAGRPIRRVICTHFHPDHSGLAGWLATQAGAPILMSRVEWLTLRRLVAEAAPDVPAAIRAWWHAAGWSADEIAAAASQGWTRIAALVSPLPHGFVALAAGDTLRVGDRVWRVVTGQGHSPDHVCLLDEAGALLIAGDQILPRISPNVSLGAAEPEGDPLGDWLASLDRLAALPAGLLVLPGHGAPFTGLHDRVAAIAGEHHGRLDALTRHLERPARARDCFAALFRRPITPEHLGLATGEALAHLRRLEVTGRATRETVDGVWWWRAA